jgi:hypothetical protein
MPEAGSKAIAVGYPGGVNVAFDAATCRLVYAWGGNFLDASPVWNNRGGAPAKLLGPKFWAGPPGNPWGIGSSQQPPDFVTRSKDPAYGAPLPDGVLYPGPMAVHFDGYRLDPAGRPTFRYRVDYGSYSLSVAERPEPLKSVAGLGVARHFELKGPPDQHGWLLAGESDREPRLYTEKGEPVPLDLKAATPEAPAAGKLVVLPQAGDAVFVLAATKAPEGTAWRFAARPGGGWLAIAKVPAGKDGLKADLTVSTWSLPRDDAGLLRELLAK